MTRGWAFFWVVLCFPLGVVDGWLSVQSLFGLWHPTNLVGYVMAVVVGLALTAFTVTLPIFSAYDHSPPLRLLRVVLLVFDVATSILGAIWYGVGGQPYNSQIDVHRLQLSSATIGQTLGAVALVALLCTACVVFGKALTVLTDGLRREPQQPVGGP